MQKQSGMHHFSAPLWCLQNFIRAVAEAKEVWDRRRNIKPATSHNPVDFLDPSTYPHSEGEEALFEDAKRDLR